MTKAVAPASSVRTRVREVLANERQLLDVFERVYEAGALDPTSLGAAVGVPPARVRLFVTGLIAKLRNAGIESPIEIEESPVVFRYRGER